MTFLEATLVPRLTLLLIGPIGAVVLAVPVTGVFDGTVPAGYSLLFLGLEMLALLAAPGYLYMTWNMPSSKTSSLIVRVWIRTSLVAGMLLSVFGIYGGYLMTLFFPVSFLSLIGCLFLLWFFEVRSV
jgi:hypothetical protein